MLFGEKRHLVKISGENNLKNSTFWKSWWYLGEILRDYMSLVYTNLVLCVKYFKIFWGEMINYFQLLILDDDDDKVLYDDFKFLTFWMEQSWTCRTREHSNNVRSALLSQLVMPGSTIIGCCCLFSVFYLFSLCKVQGPATSSYVMRKNWRKVFNS